MKRLVALALPQIAAFRIPGWLKIAGKWACSLAVLIYLVQYLNKFGETGYTLPFQKLFSASFAGILVLMSVNWGLEIYKWGLLLGYRKISFQWWGTIRSVLIGLAAGLITPNRTGEYVGRLAGVPASNRMEAAGLLLFERWGQMLATLFGGAFAWTWFSFHPQPDFPVPLGWIGAAAWTMAATGLVLLLSMRNLPGNTWWKKLRLEGILDGFSGLSLEIRIRVLALSVLRFMVFTLQFAWIMLLLGFEGGWLAATSMAGIVFWVKSFIPSMALAELGIRESIAIFIGSWFFMGPEIAALSAFLLFLINLVIPALIGLVFWLNPE